MVSTSRLIEDYKNLLRKDPKLLIAIISIILLLTGTYVFSSDVGVLGNVVIIVIIAVATPYFLISYLKFAKIREIENRFPQFLRDVADSVQSGYSLPAAFKQAATTDYGRLTPEVKRMASQLSWGVTFDRTVRLFMKRLKKSDIITRSMTIVLEAYNAGGNIAPILNSAADSVVTIKEAEYEKRSLLREHVVMMYAIFFIFIGIVLALTGILLPILNLTSNNTSASGGSFSGAALKGGDPCQVCKAFQCTLCSGFTSLGTSMGFGEGVKAYYKAIFFMMIMIQAVFSGLVAGQIGEDSLKAGVKHSIIMVGCGFAIFIISVRLGFV